VLRQLWDNRAGVVSVQVLQELYVTLTEKIAAPIPRRDARDLLNAYSAWPVVALDIGDVRAASDLEDRFRLKFWDALVVTAALKAGATMLLSPGFHPYRQIGGLEIRNPFE